MTILRNKKGARSAFKNVTRRALWEATAVVSLFVVTVIVFAVIVRIG